MKEEEVLHVWRTQFRLPYTMTEEEIVWFWTLEDKPYSVRVEVVKKYSERFNIRTLIETGTYQGDMIEANLTCFDKIISIELENLLYNAAKHKFSPYPHITIVHGDSGKVLEGVLKSINEPCLFWLDGHYVPYTPETARGDKDTPIVLELDHILSHRIDHVILIDDARCFIGPNPILRDYPTIRELQDLVTAKRPDWVFEVKDDIIRIHK